MFRLKLKFKYIIVFKYILTSAVFNLRILSAFIMFNLWVDCIKHEKVEVYWINLTINSFLLSNQAYFQNLWYLYTQVVCELAESLHLLKIMLDLKLKGNECKIQNYNIYFGNDFCNFSNEIFPYIIQTYVK